MSKYKFGYNADKNKSDWVRVEFKDLTEKQMDELFLAEKHLMKAGVSFDTGYAFDTNTRDWELDWSLNGAVVKVKKK